MTSGSARTSPIFFLGLRLANGFWKTICTLRRMRLRASASTPTTSRSSSRSEPAVGSSSIVASRASVLLPQPDSPTTASVRPAPSRNDTPSSARTIAFGFSQPAETG